MRPMYAAASESVGGPRRRGRYLGQRVLRVAGVWACGNLSLHRAVHMAWFRLVGPTPALRRPVRRRSALMSWCARYGGFVAQRGAGGGRHLGLPGRLGEGRGPEPAGRPIGRGRCADALGRSSRGGGCCQRQRGGRYGGGSLRMACRGREEHPGPVREVQKVAPPGKPLGLTSAEPSGGLAARGIK